ncbi:hypothetical protein BBJ28_00013734 [Nothophytophthora sp. Chile5]|nr:hypothetical protein BBJ28_00013734 [Nothophytophthora sp. Chile5]
MAAGIPTGFVRKLYRILDHESAAIICWDADGASFSIHDSAALNTQVLPRYFRGRLCAFRQQLVDHGFQQSECEEHESREVYAHPDFRRGCPGRLSRIERRPKPKKKLKAGQPAANGELKPVVSPPLASQKQELSLTVMLNVAPEGRSLKRGGSGDVTDSASAKRQRLQVQAATQGTQKTAVAKPAVNPLFSNEPDTGALSLAKFVEGSGLLPASSDLPDPISYLSRVSSASRSKQQEQAGRNAPAAAPAPSVPMFSDDMVKSALFFLVSSSATGLETAPTATATAAATTTPSTSGFLASLLASSSTGGGTTGAWARGSNPLFSDQSADGEEEPEDSIWNLLVASSVDRVRSAIDDVTSPQEKLRLILAEREKLEEQRKKVGAPAGPVVLSKPVSKPPPSAAASEIVKPELRQNPLFATGNGTTAASGGRSAPAEDDLWRLLMSSSIDSFRRVTDLGL